MNYYNEFDPKTAAWLRELIAQGHLPPGHVDERSIVEVQPDDLEGYTQCHFFAGVGGWVAALALAAWPEDKPVWTGSCPCPPFSSAGKKKLCPACGGKPIPHPLKTGVFACVPCGHEWLADARHLWPEFLRLIAHREPAVVFGEQVAGADGLIWLAGVRATLEVVGYGLGSADLCAAGVGSPQIRQRLWWVADARHQSARRGARPCKEEGGRACHQSSRCGIAGRLVEPDSHGWDARESAASATGHGSSLRSNGGAGGMDHTLSGGRPPRGDDHGEHERIESPSNGEPGGLADSTSVSSAQQQPQSRQGSRRSAGTEDSAECDGSGGLGSADRGGCEGMRRAEPAEPDQSSYWAAYDIVHCLDSKSRRVEPGTFPLAHGLPARVVRLRGYGNAIVPQIAAQFIEAYLDSVSLPS